MFRVTKLNLLLHELFYLLKLNECQTYFKETKFPNIEIIKLETK